MSKKYDGIVLDDDLFKYYHQQYDKGNIDKIVRRVFHYMKGGRIVTTIRQYNETGTALPQSTKKSLANVGLIGLTNEEVASMTPYKIILSQQQSAFPYVNVLSDDEKIENDLVGSFEHGENRSKVEAHLKALCQDASHIVIYDKYISNNSAQEHTDINFLEKILPKKKLDIDCYFIKGSGRNDLASRCQEWNVNSYSGNNNHHDRYLIIDGKIEIILSSGFYHAGNTQMDFTYVVRYIKKNQNRFA